MKTLRTREIVDKVIGEVFPVGETNTDNDRFENLKDLIVLTESLITTIEQIAEMKNYTEFSIRRAGKLASEFRNRLTAYEG